MLFAFLGAVIALFFVLSIPVLVTKVTTTPVMVRNISVAVFLAIVGVVFQLNGPVALFIAGILVCSSLSVIERKEGTKLLLLEPAMICGLILMTVILKEDAGGLFAGRGIGPTIAHVEGVLYKNLLPIQAEFAGLFTLGGVLGVLLSIPLKPRINRWIERNSYVRSLKRQRELPETAVFGDRFAPWRLLMRGRRKLVARINRVTLR